MNEIGTIAGLDLNRLIDEARRGVLTIPLSQLPPAVRALLTPAMEEGQRVKAAEEREIFAQRREHRQSKDARDWLAEKSPAYQRAYEEFFTTVANSQGRLDTALSELNDSERRLSARLAELERHAVHLPDGRLAFLENGRFVFADGSAVVGEELDACLRAKRDADEKREPITSWRQYAAVRDALADTIEVEQRISNASADIVRAGDNVRKRPPEGEDELQRDTAAIQKETDDAVAQALNRYSENKRLLSAGFTTVDAEEPPPSRRPDSKNASANASFNASATGAGGNSRSPPKPEILDFDQVNSAAMRQPEFVPPSHP